MRRPAWPLHPVPLETFALLVEDVGVEQHMCTAPGLFGKFVGIITFFLTRIACLQELIDPAKSDQVVFDFNYDTRFYNLTCFCK